MDISTLTIKISMLELFEQIFFQNYFSLCHRRNQAIIHAILSSNILSFTL